MRLVDLIPDPDVLYALEPDELGLRMLPALAAWRSNQMTPLSLPAVLNAWIGDGRYDGEYPRQKSGWIEEAVREAWAWLEGAALLVEATNGHTRDVRRLSRQAHQFAQATEPRKALAGRRLPKEILHPAIREDVWALYHREKYDTAVFEATKAVEVAVRTAAGLQARDIGVPLMRKAFDPKTGPLTDNSVEEAEREARAHLFAGVIGSYKNPQSHRSVALDDADEAAEIIMLANHLLRIVDGRRAAGE